jgi:hypothetical protein
MRHLISLAELSYEFGLIGVDEFHERFQVAQWLESEDSDAIDPRVPIVVIERSEDIITPDTKILKAHVKDESEEPDWLEFLFDSKWYFTISDPDPYPSTPHGHLSNPNKPWPKLNPYTGRAFKEKHQEDTSLRLSKNKMRLLWRDSKFKSFCRDHILWYMEGYPHHVFPVKYPFRFPRW